MRRTATATIALIVAGALLAACSQEQPQIVINVPSAAPSPPAPPSEPIATPSPTTSGMAMPTDDPSMMPVDLPMDEARVQGLFGGKGFANSRFRFAPRCGEGACPVFGKSGKIQVNFGLNPSGVYSGKTTENQTCSAGGVSTSTKVTYVITFRVKTAEMIGDVWQATSLDTSTTIKRPFKKVTIGNKILTCKAFSKRSKGVSTLVAP